MGLDVGLSVKGGMRPANSVKSPGGGFVLGGGFSLKTDLFKSNTDIMREP